ncbi:MAG: flagellar biosynthesis anti-sigma factor FlgM [Deltaproteobacteria bacterium]
MKIWGNIPQIQEIYNKNKTTSKVEKSSGVSSKKDVVSISNEGKDFQAALKAAREAPDIRTDRVEEIKKKMQEDKYEVSSADVADKIVDSILNKII